MKEEISIAESYLWLVDAQTGEKTALTPRVPGAEKVAYRKARFVRGNPTSGAERDHVWRGIWVLTDQGGEFQRLALLDPDTGKLSPVSEDGPFDVEDFALSGEGDRLAYSTNEEGRSVLRVIGLRAFWWLLPRPQPGVGIDDAEPAVQAPRPVLPEIILRFVPPNQPAGVFSGLKWAPPLRGNVAALQDLVFNVANAQAPSDVYRYRFGVPNESWLNLFPEQFTTAKPVVCRRTRSPRSGW